MIAEAPWLSQYARHPLSIARILWKQRVRILVIWLALSSLAVPVVSLLPKSYHAEVTILVDSQKIPDKFISSTVNTSVQDKLATITQQIMSTNNLLKIIGDLHLYEEEQKRLSQEEILRRMRKDIHIAPMQGQQGGFAIAFEGSDPVEITSVANQIGNQLVKQNVESREEQAEGTTAFIRNELNLAKQRLDEQEARVAEYKLSHNGELPQQEAAIVSLLGRLQMQVQNNHDAIARAYQNKTNLENLLQVSETRNQLGKDLRKPSERAELELQQMLENLTENHPRVKKQRETIARLKTQEELEDLDINERTNGVRSQLAVSNQEIKTKEQENQRLLKQIELEQSRLQRLPAREQEMVGMTRDYEMSKNVYTSLLDKVYAAEMATNLEKKQKSERFTVLNSARVPQNPSKPNEPVALSVGVCLALAVSVGLALSRGLARNTLLGEWELPAGVIVLGRVPMIESKSKRLRTRLSGAAGLLLVFCASLAAGSLLAVENIFHV